MYVSDYDEDALLTISGYFVDDGIVFLCRLYGDQLLSAIQALVVGLRPREFGTAT